MSTTTRPQTRTAAAEATEEQLRASPLGSLLLELGTDILDLQSLFSPAELSAMADDKNHPIYAGLSCLQNGEMHDTMVCVDLASRPIPDRRHHTHAVHAPRGSGGRQD